MKEEGARAGIDLIFIDAIDGRSLTLADVREYDRKARTDRAPDLTPNEVACALSHKRALEFFLNSDATAAVILEDDVILNDNFARSIDAIAGLKLTWDAVNLENRNKKQLRAPVAGPLHGTYLHASAWVSKGSACWLYSKKGANLVYLSLDKFRHAYDTHLGFFWRHGFAPLCVEPPLVSHANTPSTISSTGEPERLFAERDLTWRQFLYARAERIEHEVRKEIAARIIYIRMKREMQRKAPKESRLDAGSPYSKNR